jgi:cbb3-type cytochrome oxidase subunit 3
MSDNGVRGEMAVGPLIMLGTLFGLIVLICGLVVYFDPEARGAANHQRNQ